MFNLKFLKTTDYVNKHSKISPHNLIILFTVIFPFGLSLVANANPIDFYNNEKLPNVKWTIKEIWNFSENDIDQKHGFMQWLFPTDWQSHANPESKPITAEEIRQFQNSSDLKDKVFKSFKLLAEFYGFKILPTLTTEYIVPGPKFADRIKNLTGTHKRDKDRITRILASLHILGLTGVSKEFYRALINYIPNSQISDEYWNTWKNTANAQDIIPIYCPIKNIEEWEKAYEDTSNVHNYGCAMYSYQSDDHHGAAGVMIIADHGYGDGIYVLLGQEKMGKYAGTWGIMWGSVDDGETAIEAAARELNEESAGVYEASLAELRNSPFFEGIFILKRQFLGSRHLRLAAKHATRPHFDEMSDYIWVPLKDLRQALHNSKDTFTAKTPIGSERTIKLRNGIFNRLRLAEERGILEKIDRATTMKFRHKKSD